jgi:hypothetical protein
MPSEIVVPVGRLLDLSADKARIFAQMEPRAWTVSALSVELVAEYGSLAHCVMDHGGYKVFSRFDADRAENECSDVVFILSRILIESGCRIPSDRMLGVGGLADGDTSQSLFLAATSPLPGIVRLAGGPDVEAGVMDAFSALARLAVAMGLRPLEVVHEEVMKRTGVSLKRYRRLRWLRRPARWARRSIRRR